MSNFNGEIIVSKLSKDAIILALHHFSFISILFNSTFLAHEDLSLNPDNNDQPATHEK